MSATDNIVCQIRDCPGYGTPHGPLPAPDTVIEPVFTWEEGSPKPKAVRGSRSTIRVAERDTDGRVVRFGYLRIDPDNIEWEQA